MPDARTGSVAGCAGPRCSAASPHDREIVRLALPAFGALAAEPLYVLADTAIVGHLGTRPLGGLGVAGDRAHRRRSASSTSSPTPRPRAVARRIGAGDERAAAEQGVDGIWLALGLGVALTVVGLARSRR